MTVLTVHMHGQQQKKMDILCTRAQLRLCGIALARAQI